MLFHRKVTKNNEINQIILKKMRNIFESASKIRSFGRNIKEYIVGLLYLIHLYALKIFRNFYILC
ncbi:hypothetical protein HMPREF9073_02612 [Capnocytophaga sp. oral taxon 326 str. F0382]|nr:hypothetical protein HMPREF9073_02612 [Capnocytophaga sp. oral taxon 326 str. F0382]